MFTDVPGVPSRPPGSGMAAEMANGLLSSDWAHQNFLKRHANDIHIYYHIILLLYIYIYYIIYNIILYTYYIHIIISL